MTVSAIKLGDVADGATTIGVFVSLIGVLISLYAVKKSFVLQRQALSEEVAGRLRERAEAVVQKVRQPLADPLLEENREALNFFEEVGRLVDKGSLEEATAWALFCEDVSRLHGRTHEAIKAFQVQQNNDTTIWREFLELHARLQGIDSQERSTTPRGLASYLFKPT